MDGVDATDTQLLEKHCAVQHPTSTVFGSLHVTRLHNPKP